MKCWSTFRKISIYSESEDPATLVFEDYYDEEKVNKGLQDGSFFKVINYFFLEKKNKNKKYCNIHRFYDIFSQDLIRINQKNYKEAYLFCPVSGKTTNMYKSLTLSRHYHGYLNVHRTIVEIYLSTVYVTVTEPLKVMKL